MKIHIISVGASIITNFKRKFTEIDVPNIDEDKRFEIFLTDKTRLNGILEFVNDDPYRASAELNALKNFLEKKEVDEVHLIVTDTFIGRITSEVISRWLKANGIISSSKTIPGYYKEMAKDEVEAEEKFVKGLTDLRDSLLDFIKSKKSKDPGCEILINATGGFKPEILILMLVGSLTKCKVYYIHEFFKRTMILPPIFLPYVNNEISSALDEINSKPPKRISGESLCLDFKKRYNTVYNDLLNSNLISEKFGEKDDKLFEIKLASYGKLLTELKS